MKRLLVIAGLFIAVVSACVKTEPVSSVPHITFKSFQLFDAHDSALGNTIMLGVLEFSFVDGDADIGISTMVDSNMPDDYNYNVFLFPYKKINGNYIKIEIDTSTPPPFYRIVYDPKLDRVGQNKTIKGSIKINIEYFVIPPYDTIRYNFYITDRAMNKSNVDSTTDIVFR